MPSLIVSIKTIALTYLAQNRTRKMGVRYEIRDMYQFCKRTHSVSGRPTWMHVVIPSTGGFIFKARPCAYTIN